MGKYSSTWKEREEYIAKRALELGDMDRNEKRKIIKKEVIEKFGVKESTAGWQTWNYLHQKEKETVE